MSRQRPGGDRSIIDEALKASKDSCGSRVNGRLIMELRSFDVENKATKKRARGFSSRNNNVRR